ncbi:MAG: haloacid dehalogenase [Acidilobaceae archaeon]
MGLEEVLEAIDRFLAIRDNAREEAIRISRDIVRLSKQVITLIHGGDVGRASTVAMELESKVRLLEERVSSFPDLYYSGLTYNALSEYVEASLLLDVALGRDLRGFEELRVPPVPYLQGLGDLVGELRRLALEKVRSGDFSEAWRLYRVMESIYVNLSKLEYPESLIPGVRHKVDVARRLLDETLALLVDLESRRALAESIASQRARQLEF